METHGSIVKESARNAETHFWSLGQEDSLEEEMATHPSILAWKIPWTEEPCGYGPWVCNSVRNDLATKQQ